MCCHTTTIRIIRHRNLVSLAGIDVPYPVQQTSSTMSSDSPLDRGRLARMRWRSGPQKANTLRNLGFSYRRNGDSVTRRLGDLLQRHILHKFHTTVTPQQSKTRTASMSLFFLLHTARIDPRRICSPRWFFPRFYCTKLRIALWCISTNPSR
jgi:hypothetical protein